MIVALTEQHSGWIIPPKNEFYARATSLLSYTAGGALSPIRVKQPGALFEQLSSWHRKLESQDYGNEAIMVRFFLL